MTVKSQVALAISSLALGAVALSGLLGIVPLNRKFNYIELACDIVMLIVIAPVVVNSWRKK